MCQNFQIILLKLDLFLENKQEIYILKKSFSQLLFYRLKTKGFEYSC